ncbi:MAG: WG repeat-containing protein [Massilia sp.]
MIRPVVGALLLMLAGFAVVACTSSDLCPPTDQKAEWSSQCFAGSGADRHVKRAYLRLLKPNASGHTTIIIGNPHELVAVDRRGMVVIPNIIHTGDFDFPDARDGIGRFAVTTRDEQGRTAVKCGYFDSRGFNVVIPPSYDECQPFDGGQATVCNDCATYCTEPECQNSRLIGGKGYAIDRNNKIVRKLAQPPLEQACSGSPPEKVVKVTPTRSYFQCAQSASSPFGGKP